MTREREPLLVINGLRVAYGETEVVHGVDLTVERGEVVALVGESGSGKTTLAHAVVGLLPAGGEVVGGEIRFDGERIDSAPVRRLEKLRGSHIGVVPQDPTSALNPVRRIGDQVAEILRIHGRANRRTAALDAIRILDEAGIDRPEIRARQHPSELSGGQRQRVLIGIALACSPELVIADEPTSALDVTVQKRILDHLDERVDSTGAAVLFITHDLGVAADRADRIVVLRDGVIVEDGPTAQILTSPAHEYTAHLLAAAPSLSQPRTRRTAPRVDGSPLLSLQDVGKTFRAGGEKLVAVDSVSLEIRRGQTVSLVGESGSGKSTTARIAARLETPTTGSVRFDDTDISSARGKQLRDFRRRVQFVHQNPYLSLDPSLSVGDIVAEPLRAFGIGDRAGRRTRVAELLASVSLSGDVADRRPARLSGGQRQRVAIARALALEPDLVILDEPVSALDVSVQATILELLDELQRDLGLTYLFISHDLAVVRQISDEVAVMRGGQIVEHGEVSSVFDTPTHPYTRELRSAVPGQARTTTG
ncbi:dipeptide ABC transporter ATP-binding protein [Williamsia maris]|uniref:Peptide/nickel transport system ATP-binding protein n=1 Tax=Williamsia maris TaxID=72806 RepID=A0ABT1H9L9_9NOCA|nr:ABC transporter ATP-binding protein [Williamsia maris]MCP2174951.1 peptide/nickel transport system ATP-binding protein [Williamsia maris]